MTKLRKMMVMLVFVVVAILGITAGTGNAKAATTKNFKGNLNVTYSTFPHVKLMELLDKSSKIIA